LSALIPCLVVARTTLLVAQGQDIEDKMEEMMGRERREADSEDNAAVLFNLDPLENMLDKEEEGMEGKPLEGNQLEELEKIAKVAEGDGEEPRLEKSLLNTFPFNQHHDGAHHGDHHAHHDDHHGDRHGEHGAGHHDGDHDHEYSSSTLDRSASSAPLRDHQGPSAPLRSRLSNRVKDVVANKVRQQLGQGGFAFRQGGQGGQSLNAFQARQGQSGNSFPFGNVAGNRFRNDEEVEDEEDGFGSGAGPEVDETDVSFNIIGQAAAQDEEVKGGRKCIDKVMMVEVTEYDEVITCDHSYDKRCHTSYVTNYDSQQEEECEENFKKVCHINYEPLAYNETVEICRTPIVKDCDIPGETVCQTVYETECSTEQKVHEVEDDVTSCRTELMTKCRDVTVGYVTKPECDEWPVERCTLERKLVKKYTPETACYKEPRELCAPRGCGFRNGTVECHDKVKTIVVDNPLETCKIEPQRTCKHVTKLVPRLVAAEECVDVPKEVCSRSKSNPRKIKKPIIKKWCYVPSKESGLQ